MISVIIPIYNAAHYLPETIESVLAQDHKNFELILVNDGSVDRSLDICNEYSIKDSRILVIDQKNNGVSSARNAGLEDANGEYICFIDADDWVENDYLSTLSKDAEEKNSDLVISNVKKQLPDKTIKGNNFKKDLLESESFLPSDFFVDDFFVLENPPFAKLFKKSIIDKNSLRFDKELKNGEDFIFVLEYALHCKKITFINKFTYNYNLNSDSSVTQKYFKNYYYHLKKTKDSYLRILERYGPVSEEEKLYQYFRVASKAIVEEGKGNNSLSFKKRYNSIKELLSISEIVDFRKKYSLRKDNSRFYFFLQNLMMMNQPLLITIFLTIYFKK
ncbi:MAG: glycosyltransferase family 2 protein [Chryseobacterium sp.]|nr:glycosyltransferase family 2 protein [Chryseobacterium sp.]